MRKSLTLLFLLPLFTSCLTSPPSPLPHRQKRSAPPTPPSLSSAAVQQIGRKIWQREGAGKREHLIVWNEGEEFASLGIGHFIWYPAGRVKQFGETFPQLLDFFETQNLHIPRWLDRLKGCPWSSREEFLREKSDPFASHFRLFLSSKRAIYLQALFIVQRAEKQFERIEKKAREESKLHVVFALHKLRQTTKGLYALIDYIHFKGTGIDSEKYWKVSWGAFQVLEGMDRKKMYRHPLREFIASAKRVLRRRVQHAPPHRGEERWLPGWYARLDSYL